MIPKIPLILDNISNNVKHQFKDSCKFYEDSFYVNFVFKSFNGEQKNVGHINNLQSMVFESEFFWFGNYSKLRFPEKISEIYISNNPAYLVKYANIDRSINWYSSLFISTCGMYNIPLLKSLLSKFNTARVIDVFPNHAHFNRQRAITELAHKEKNYSITRVEDMYAVHNERGDFKLIEDREFKPGKLRSMFFSKLKTNHKKLKL